MLARVLLFLLALTCYAHASALVPVVTSPQGPSWDCNLLQPYGAAINAGCPGAAYTGPSLATQWDASGVLVYKPTNLVQYSNDLNSASLSANWTSAGNQAVVSSLGIRNNSGTGTQSTAVVANAGWKGGPTADGRGYQIVTTGSAAFYLAKVYSQMAVGIAVGQNVLYSEYVQVPAGFTGTVDLVLVYGGNAWTAAGRADFGGGTMSDATSVYNATFVGSYLAGGMIPLGGNQWRLWLLAKNNSSQSVGPETDTVLNTAGTFIVGGQQVEPWLASAAAGPSAYMPTSGSAYYGPRFDYDPVAQAPRCLLTEEQRQNLLWPSNTFNGANSGSINATVVSGAAVSPDGASDAWKLVDNTTNGQHIINNGAVSVTAGNSYVVSAFVKAAEYSSIVMDVFGLGTNNGGYAFNLASKTATFVNISGGTAATVSNPTFASVGGGWYRIAFTVSAVATLASNQFRLALHNGTTYTFVGTGSSGIYIYGGQVAPGSVLDSYIPTFTGAVTRSADVATVPTSAFQFNPIAGTLYADMLTNANDNGPGVMAQLDASAVSGNNRYSLGVSNATTFGPRVVVSSTVVIGTNGGSFAAGSMVKAALSYQAGAVAVYGSGSLIARAVLNPLVSGINEIAIGATGGTFQPDAWICHVRYWPRGFSDALLQQKTSANDRFRLEAAA